MNNKTNKADKYFSNMFYKMITVAPIAGLAAGVTFTVAWLFGFFSYAVLYQIIIFDCICLSYFFIAYACRKIGIKKNGEIDQKGFTIVKHIFALVTIIQWNIISYVFPTNDFWGFAPFFVLLVAFTFDKAVILFEISLMSLSIAISWLIKGQYLLPASNFIFTENFILRIVCLIVSFTTIYLLTYFSEKFTITVRNVTEELEDKNEKLEGINNDIISYTAEIIEQRDFTSGSHVKRVRNITKIIAKNLMKITDEYKLGEEEIDMISLASTLHDIGKVSIPDDILLKPGKLTKEEFDIIKTHTTKGAELVESLPDSIDIKFKKYCKDITLYHHEKVDGKGYPVGLKGDEIPIAAQIVSVVDCYDALTSKRPYKDMMPSMVAIKMILNGECGEFSENIKQALIDSKEELEKMF